MNINIGIIDFNIGIICFKSAFSFNISGEFVKETNALIVGG